MEKQNVLYLHNQALRLIYLYEQDQPVKENELKHCLADLSCKIAPYGISSKTIEEKCKKFNIQYQPSEKSSYQEITELMNIIDKNINYMIRLKQLQKAYPEWSKSFIDKYNNYIKTTVKHSSFTQKGSKIKFKTINGTEEECQQDQSKQLYEEFLDFLYTLFLPNELERILHDIVDMSNPVIIDDLNNESKEWTGSLYHDNNRVNLTVKYKYEKKCHFRDTLNQFQGLQNKKIDKKVLEDLKEAIQKHGLCNEEVPEDDLLKRYSRVTIDHIRLFLTETEHFKHYEDLQLIYSKISGKKCPDISRFEKQLYDDFDQLVEVFCSLPDVNRKNFLNVHYVLRQLLKRRGYKVPDNYLSNLKTPSRMREHDDIYQKCC